MRISRRHLLGGGLALSAGGLMLPKLIKADEEGPRFLIILGCFGGASMLDCYLPVDSGEALTTERGTVISYSTERVGNIRSVSRDTPVSFLERYGQDAVVLGSQASSVNHFVAQARSINGRDVYAGRTLAEAVASVHGQDMALPNVNMGRGGFTQPGFDPTLLSRYKSEIVVNPVTFPLSTHGHAGILHLGEEGANDPELRAELVEAARRMRDERLEAASPFGRTFSNSRIRRELLLSRQANDPTLEVQELIEQLLFVPDLGELFPLSEYGLSPSEETDRIRAKLPDAMPYTTSGLARDRLQAQAALAYLLIKTGTSAAVTLTEPGTDGFLAWDQSHTNHRSAQKAHWDRVLDTAGRLIDLLADTPYVGPGAVDGQTLWDRSLLVFATEFGRDKWDLGSGFGTGHHLNNGTLVVSPLLRGDQSLGEADPNNGFICGFDAETGEPTPFDDIAPGEDPLFSDERLPPGEEPIYGTLCEALGVRYEGQETLPVMLKG